MKNLIISLFSLFIVLEASQNFQPNIECKECHPIIYKEHQNTMHNKATIFKDPIHSAIWNKHPLKKKGKYKCAKCHTPTSASVELPKEEKHEEAISCAYCHRIQAVEKGFMANKNIISSEEKDYFGGLDKPLRNKFHYQAKNENFINGNVCMGCHSHKKNKEKLDVCVTDMSQPNDKENCITCHMPRVEGSISNKSESTMHRYHGFPGANSGAEMLSQYVDINFTKNETGFSIEVHNQSPHDLLLHPLRLTQLNVSIIRDGNVHDLRSHTFVRVIGKDKKPTPPWLANAIVKNTMIKGKEKRKLEYQNIIQSGDKIKVVLGFYLVNPKILKQFELENNAKAKKFTILKDKIFEVK